MDKIAREELRKKLAANKLETKVKVGMVSAALWTCSNIINYMADIDKFGNYVCSLPESQRQEARPNIWGYFIPGNFLFNSYS